MGTIDATSDDTLRRRARQRTGARRVVRSVARPIAAMAVGAGAASLWWSSTAPPPERSNPVTTSAAALAPSGGPAIGAGAGDSTAGVDRADPRFGLAADERAVAVVRSGAPLPIRVGDRVELLAVGLRDDAVVALPLGAARVVDLDEHTVTVAVTAERARAVVAAQAAGAVELIGRPG